jgi:hypothetical protein
VFCRAELYPLTRQAENYLSLENMQDKVCLIRRLITSYTFVILTPLLLLTSDKTVFAATAPAVWVASSMQSVGLNDAAGTNNQAVIAAARGEYESFQIVVTGVGQAVSGVDISFSDLTGPGGAQIASTNISPFREKYTYVNESSPDWGGSNRPLGAGWYADALIPWFDPATGKRLSGAQVTAAPFSVAVNQNQPTWVDVFVPRNAVAGQYTGTYSVVSAQGSVTGSIQLTVWNFTLPVVPALKSSFAFFQAQPLAANEELLRNRLMPISVNPSEESLLISDFGLGASTLGMWSGADAGNCVMSAPPSNTQIQSAIQSHQPQLYLWNFTADEVGSCTALYPELKKWALALHQAGARQLVTMAPVPELFDDGSGTGR